MNDYVCELKEKPKKGKVRNLINTITIESERDSVALIAALKTTGYDFDIERVQTSTYDGKFIIKVYVVEK